MPAQGELRGPRINNAEDTLKTTEPEAQYGGGDAAAIVGDQTIAARTRARYRRNRALADQNLQEYWTRGEDGNHYLSHYRDATTGVEREFVQ